MALLQFNVSVGDKTHLIAIQEDAKVDDLFNVITKNYPIGINPSNIRLLCGDQYLDYGHGKCFKDYGLTHLSTAIPILLMCGGIWPLQPIEERKRNLVPLPGFITVTSSPAEPDMITLEDSPEEKRAKMPCGHVIGPNSMISYCQSLLSEGKFKFYCPSVDKAGEANCNREWEYFLVRHVACLTPDEMKEFEMKISNNYLQKSKVHEKCPGCNTLCYKEAGTGNRVFCPLCKRTFCWACLKDWISASNAHMCGNSDCDGMDSRTRVLANCPTKQIQGCRACPMIRACPECGMLTELRGAACAHVTCPNCELGFCFICLKGKTSNGDWPCSYVGKCTLAPRQMYASAKQPESDGECTIL